MAAAAAALAVGCRWHLPQRSTNSDEPSSPNRHVRHRDEAQLVVVAVNAPELRAKLGWLEAHDEDQTLVTELLQLMQSSKADFCQISSPQSFETSPISKPVGEDGGRLKGST